MGVQLFIVTVAEQGTGHLWAGSVCQQQDPSSVTLHRAGLDGPTGVSVLVFRVVLREVTEVV